MPPVSNVAPRTNNVKSGFPLPYICVLILTGVVILFIAGTIAIALIPVYLSNKQLTPNPNVARSQPVTLSITVEQNPTTSIGKRKRAVSDLADYVPGQLNVDGKQMVARTLLKIFQNNEVQSINVTDATLDNISNSRRKRSSHFKRASFSGYETAFIVRFFIQYKLTCLRNCQNTAGANMIKTITPASLQSFDFSNVPISVNGIIKIAPRIRFVSLLYITDIVSSTNPMSPTAPILQIDSTTTPTTITTTPSTSTTTTSLSITATTTTQQIATVSQTSTSATPTPTVTPTTGPVMQTTGIPMGTTGLGIQTTGPGMQTTGPAIQTTGIPIGTTGPAIQTTGPGMQTTGAGMQTTGPAMQTTGPAIQTTGPAIQTTGAGMQTTGPAIQTTGAGMQTTGIPMGTTGPAIQTTGMPMGTTGPGIQTTGPAIQTTGIPMGTTGPAIQTTGPGMQTTGAGMQTTGTVVQTTS